MPQLSQCFWPRVLVYDTRVLLRNMNMCTAGTPGEYRDTLYGRLQITCTLSPPALFLFSSLLIPLYTLFVECFASSQSTLRETAVHLRPGAKSHPHIFALIKFVRQRSSFTERFSNDQKSGRHYFLYFLTRFV